MIRGRMGRKDGLLTLLVKCKIIWPGKILKSRKKLMYSVNLLIVALITAKIAICGFSSQLDSIEAEVFNSLTLSKS
jgi:hypothetical protein